jgi:hypothetical protein
MKPDFTIQAATVGLTLFPNVPAAGLLDAASRLKAACGSEDAADLAALVADVITGTGAFTAARPLFQ